MTAALCSKIIWWFGAISLIAYAALGSLICIGLLGDYALRRIGWARPLILWWADRLRGKAALADHCTCQRFPTHCANDCPLHGEIEA